MDRRYFVAAVWIASALTMPAELFAGWTATGSYDWFDQTISELGASECLATCSPAHGVLNAAMVVSGLCLTMGACWLAAQLSPGWCRWVAALSTGLGGLSTAATGMIPLDRDPNLHVLVSIPALALAAVPVIALAPAALGAHRWIRRVVLMLAVAGVLTGATVALWLDAPWPGLLERVAVWPSSLLVATIGATLAVTSSRSAPADDAGQSTHIEPDPHPDDPDPRSMC